ncbi:MAG: cob(I)yrinic acid a,c-diamide adenosyltransferase [Candidatus Omnitrophota bacterium]|nr:cob(I)yrinic acid a,c-diamide adenosyltransferase [Candidatus Omnitrophota bacterium]
MIQVYTGDGKGKTTAALGLALRAAGAGKQVYLCQFLKGRFYCELASLKKLKNIKIEQFGARCFLRKTPDEKDIAKAKAALAGVEKAIRSRQCDMIIMDELNVALNLGLIGLKEALKVIKGVPKRIELIITGRGAHPEIIKLSELDRENKEVKHYYKKGLKARRGIEF